MIDLYKILLTTALYGGNSFYGPEFVDLLVDEELKTYYIRVAIRQPIGDYGWTTVFAWYKSDAEKHEEIRRIVLEALNDGKGV